MLKSLLDIGVLGPFHLAQEVADIPLGDKCGGSGLWSGRFSLHLVRLARRRLGSSRLGSSLGLSCCFPDCLLGCCLGIAATKEKTEEAKEFQVQRI